MTLSFDQIRKFFEVRHPGQKIGTREKASVRCAFHDDRTPSCTLFLSGNGGYHCNGCGASGNLFMFEARFSNCSLAEAEQSVAALTGAKVVAGFASKLGPVVAAYDYRDNDGRLLYQKRRYEPEGQSKTFRVFRPEGSGWAAGIDPSDGTRTKRVLYNQPLLVAAHIAIVCEGEKDADNLAQSGLWAEKGSMRFATTCNFDGAWKPGESGKWAESYNAYFAGKFVIIFADNDVSGETWAQAVAANVEPYAQTVKIVRLPGLPEKGDVSDWLAAGHSAQELEVQIAKAPNWKPAVVKSLFPMFQDAVEFAAEADATTDWLIQGVIPRSGGGFIGGHPKAAKTFASLDLAMSASCGVPWMGFSVPKPIRTAVISREDEPGLTRRRIAKLVAGRSDYAVLEGRMLINTRQHQADFRVTNDDHLNSLIDQLGRFGAELVVLDVFRSIHDAEENDNSAIAQVLAKITRIQTELKCACAVVHHISKGEGTANIFRGLRGASVIHGWMEWGIGISVTNPEEEDRSLYIRKCEFESKECTSASVLFRIAESADNSTVALQQVDKETVARKTKARTTADILPIKTRERKDLA